MTAGRPELPAAEKRDVYIMVRLTRDEKTMVREAAKASWRSPGELARSLLMQYAEEKLRKG